ncbi:MAG: hypothetical protein ACLFVJ_11340 [Persicimonas sp.]
MRRSQIWRVGAVIVSLIISLVLISAQMGCAQTAEEMAEETGEEVAEGAAAPAVSQTLAELDEPSSRQQLNRLLSLPALADAGELFGRGLSRGAFDVWSEELSAAELESTAPTYLSAFAEALIAQIGPAIRRMIREEIGPGVAEAIRQHIGPATAQMLTDDQMQQALADTARVVGRNSLLGANQGLIEVSQGEPVGGGPMAGLGETLTAGQETLETVLWMLGAAVLVLLLLIVVLGLGLWRTFARSQELTQENKLREEALVGMARAVEAAEETDADIVESALRDIEHRDGVDRLRELLRQAGHRSGAERPD